MTDQQLLRDYAGGRSEEAFAELVRRHVDMTYSTALRLVRDAHLAEDVTQAVFVAMAQNAARLEGHPFLSGWLHRTARNVAAQAIRSAVRRRNREKEAAALNEPLVDDTETSWHRVAPQLDDALAGLDDTSRDAVMLRYFEKKSAREIGCLLGISAEAAQKRVSRAVEQLRGMLAKRGVVTGTAALVVLLSSKAVQAAPAGLALTVSAAAGLAKAAAASAVGTAVGTTSTVVSVTKAVGMTAFRNVLVPLAIVALASVGVYEARQVRDLRRQLRALEARETVEEAEARQALPVPSPTDADGMVSAGLDGSTGERSDSPGTVTSAAKASAMSGTGQFMEQVRQTIEQMEGGQDGAMDAGGGSLLGGGMSMTGGSRLSTRSVNGNTVISFRGREYPVGRTRGIVTTRAATFQGKEYAAAFDGERVIWENIPGAARKLR